MKLPVEIIDGLLKAPDVCDLLWEYLMDVWSPPESEEYVHDGVIEDYYRKNEERTRELEECVGSVYPDLYTQILPDRCRSVPTLEPPIIWMDCLSIREANLLGETLEAKGYSVATSMSFSAAPSTTDSYREKLGLRSSDYVLVKDAKGVAPNLKGNAWCELPDSRIEKVELGQDPGFRTLFSMILETVEAVLIAMGSPSATITSDHGYIDLKHSPKIYGRLRDMTLRSFGNSRYCQSIDDDEAARVLMDERRAILLSNGSFVQVNRYSAAAKVGRPKRFQHQGVSLLECLVPILKVVKKSE